MKLQSRSGTKKENLLHLRIHEQQNPDVERQEKLSVLCVLAKRVVQSAATVGTVRWENTCPHLTFPGQGAGFKPVKKIFQTYAFFSL